MATQRWLVLVVLLGGLAGLLPLSADDKDDEAKERLAAIKKQKDSAESKIKASKLKMSQAETDSLLVFSPLSEEKTTKMAASMQKSHALATKTLKIDAPGPWKGKLTVMLFQENRQFKSFVLDALKRPTQGRETMTMELKGDFPTVLIGSGLGEKPTDATMNSEAAGAVATAVLNRKAGVGTSAINFQLPEWLASSFGRVIYARTDSTRLGNFRSKVKSVYGKSNGQQFKAMNVWDAPPIADLDVIQASFVDYLAFGPLNSKFVAFAQAFKPEDENRPPDVASVLTAQEWKAEDLEAGWKKWVLTGK
jgi:hypothetical protein